MINLTCMQANKTGTICVNNTESFNLPHTGSKFPFFLYILIPRKGIPFFSASTENLTLSCCQFIYSASCYIFIYSASSYIQQVVVNARIYIKGLQHGVMYSLAKVHNALVNNFPKFRLVLSEINAATYGGQSSLFLW